MNLRMIDHAKRDLILGVLAWIVIGAIMVLAIDNHTVLETAEYQLKEIEGQPPPPPPGDTIVVLAGKVLGIGCFQIIPFTPDGEGG